MNSEAYQYFILHLLVMTATFAILALYLYRHRDFSYFSAATWAWFSLLNVYLMAPFFAYVMSDSVFVYRIVSEGLQPLYLIKASLSVVIGLASLWVGYFSKHTTVSKYVQRMFSQDAVQPTRIGWILLVIMIVLAIQSQILYGGSPWRSVEDWQMSTSDSGLGYFTGDVTGYEVNFYRLIIPISVYLFFLGRKNIAIFALSFFIFLRLFSAWSRHSVVMMFAALCLCVLFTSNKKTRKRLAIAGMVSAVVLVMFLQIRGHASISNTNISNIFEDMVKGRSTSVLAGPENQIFFVSAAFMQLDDNQGFNFGTKLLREIFVKPLPRRLMPDTKAGLEDFFDFRIFGNHFLVPYLSATKNSYPGFIGSLYSMGSWIGVILGTFFVGKMVRLVHNLSLNRGNLSKMIAIICMSMFPVIFRFDIEGIPYYLGLQLLPLLLLIHFSKIRQIRCPDSVQPKPFLRKPFLNYAPSCIPSSTRA